MGCSVRRPFPARTALGIVLLLPVSACGDAGGGPAPHPVPVPAAASAPATAPTPPTTAEQVIYGAVQAADQVGDGTRVVVARTELHGVAGFVVIHDEDQGGPDNVLGYAAIPAGVSINVVVTLDHAAGSGPYWAMLHSDARGNGAFEWPGPDGPVRAATGIRYAQRRFVLTVEP